MVSDRISVRKAVPIIALTWVIGLITALALVYFAPAIFPPLNTGNLNDNVIITTKLADGTVNSAKILDGTVTAADLADGSIITAKITDGAITASKIANGDVTTEKIADNAILTAKLADDSVTSAKILDGTITAADLSTGVLNLINVEDGAITTTKLADYAVSSIKLAPGAIPSAGAYNSTTVSTTSMTWEDMPAMSVSLTLTRTSNLVATFSTEAWLGSASGFLDVRVMINNSTQAYPDTGVTTITRDNTQTTSYSFTFYLPNVSAGTQLVTVQWQTPTGTQANVEDRTLTVTAFPA